MTPQIGIALYAGILTDTGSFRHANITSRTFEICRRVAAAGVDVAGVAAEMYQRSSIGKLRLTGALLTDMTLDAEGRGVLDPVPCDERCVVTARHDGHATRRQEHAHGDPDPVFRLDATAWNVWRPR